MDHEEEAPWIQPLENTERWICHRCGETKPWQSHKWDGTKPDAPNCKPIFEVFERGAEFYRVHKSCQRKEAPVLGAKSSSSANSKATRGR